MKQSRIKKLIAEGIRNTLSTTPKECEELINALKSLLR